MALHERAPLRQVQVRQKRAHPCPGGGRKPPDPPRRRRKKRRRVRCNGCKASSSRTRTLEIGSIGAAERSERTGIFLEHDFFGKPVSTPDQAEPDFFRIVFKENRRTTKQRRASSERLAAHRGSPFSNHFSAVPLGMRTG
jgi:hypothetical protein